MTTLACELVVYSSIASTSEHHGLLLDDINLDLPENCTRACILVTDSQAPLDEILQHFKIKNIELLRVARTGKPITEYDAWQVGQILEHEVNALESSHTRSIFIADVESLPTETMAGLAVALNGAACGICKKIRVSADFELHTEKPAYGGRLIVEQRWMHKSYFALLRGSSESRQMQANPREHLAMQVCDQPVIEDPEPLFRTAHDAQVNTADNLSNSKLIVSGGRGVKTPENFNLLQQIADHLGASVAASLPAVDMGLAPATRQVGQSGNYVKPRVYIAIGISGTPQHLAGIDPVTKIVAINNDEQATIFKVSEAGVVADCETFLPVLLDTLNQQKNPI